ncbi:BTAD domain-containing putative transcriptional regulator [Lentzea sp. NPDC058436]|uniref:BTAD domain-containing putative transcriptional regulator n=1 Tax=Lentzea sp. NPDC058436 TaxID=3346499 RepID=UPI00365AA928
MTSASVSGRVVGYLGNLVRAVVASALLLTVLIGLPLGLVHHVGWPLPDEVPSWAVLSAVLTQPMSTSLLLNGLACFCWLSWAAFVLDTGLRAADVLRGVRWPDLAAMRSPAAVLVGTIVLSALGNRAAGAAPDGIQPTSSSPVTAVETVRAPDPITGNCDSMWAVAERALGDGARWPEVFELNRGKPQPNGSHLTDPHRVFPGETLLVPATAPPPPSTPPVKPAPPPPPSTSEMPQHEEQVPQPESSAKTTAFVGIALAAAVSGALVMARRRHRGRYKPGSGLRDDLPVAPVVYELQLAPRPEHQPAEIEDATPLGARDGHEVALDLAACGGLGLVGPGAAAAARALLLTALTRRTVAITAGDLASLLGEGAVGEPPSSLQVVSSCQELAEQAPPTVLVAHLSAETRRQLEAALDPESSRRLAGVFLGQWTRGVTLYVRADGTVSSGSPGAGHNLVGVKLFHLGDNDARDLLALFRRAEPVPQPEAAAAALEISANVAPKDRLPLQLRLLGALALCWPDSEHDITNAVQPRLRELVAFLAVHPDGATREALVNALWPANTTDKTNNALNTALSRLRNAITKATGGTITDITIAGGGRYRLNPDVVEVDYWRLDNAITARRAASTAQERTDAYREVVNLYTGPLAEGVESEWVEPVREAVRRDVIDAAAALAHALRDDDPEQTLELLELARAFDPHNELLYRDIMRLQGRLGRPEAIPRTLALLTRKLAEIDDKPSPEVKWLAASLPRHHTKDQPLPP